MKRNRAYKIEEGKHRDRQRFIIACEGAKHEVAYFEALERGQPRVRLRVLGADERNLSAPKYVVERLVNFLETADLEPDDEIWIVIDTDRWSRKQLREVDRICQDHNWHLAISNPCFELWLYLHYADLPDDPPTSSKAWKQELRRRVRTGYAPSEAREGLDNAIRRAEALETDPENNVPDVLQTTLYRLGKAMKPFLV